MIRILFTGGGTGGHIYPIIAVADELKVLEKVVGVDMDLRYFGAAGRYAAVLEANNIKVSGIFSAKMRRYFDLRNIIDIPKFFISFFQAFWKVFIFMPDVLFSKGGPGALPIVLVCKFYRVPIIIHESDSVPGLANKLSSRFADRIGISFSSTGAFFQNKNVALVGNPVRKFLFKKGTEQDSVENSAQARKNFGLNPEKPVILVIGGSQGATRINSFFLDIAENLIKDWQVLHQTGVKNFGDFQRELNVVLKNLSAEEKSRYKAVPYFEDNIEDAYAACDLVVSRAGSGSIFEIAASEKPSVLIPLPEAANNHQVRNAYEYAKTGAALVIEESNLKQNIFLTQIKKLLSSPEDLKSMSEAAKNFSRPDAAKIIAEEILNLTKAY